MTPHVTQKTADDSLPPATGLAPAEVCSDFLRQCLKQKIRLLRPSPALREICLGHRWQGRYKTIRHWLYIVAFLNGVCGIVDCFLVPAADIERLSIARAVISATLVICCLFFYRRRTWVQEGLLVVLPCTTLLLVAGCTTLNGDPVLFERLIMDACFVLASGLIFLRVDFVFLFAIVAITSATFSALILASDIPLPMAKMQIILFHVCGLGALLNGQRIMMIFHYKGILLGMHHDIQARELAELNEKLEVIAQTDQLTGMLNRRGLEQARSHLPPDCTVSKLMIDIDNFKRLNDTCGHGEGDKCLVAVARCIRANLFPGEIAGRFGGEEFLLILPELAHEDVVARAEKLRAEIAQLPHPPDLPITVSIGVARGTFAHRRFLAMAADAALYRAKTTGKNRIACATEEELVAGAVTASPEAETGTQMAA